MDALAFLNNNRPILYQLLHLLQLVKNKPKKSNFLLKDYLFASA